MTGMKKDLFTVKDMLPRKYDGTSSSMAWIKAFVVVLEDLDLGWDDEYKSKVFRLLLDGEAQIWMIGAKERGETVGWTFDDWCSNLKEAFPEPLCVETTYSIEGLKKLRIGKNFMKFTDEFFVYSNHLKRSGVSSGLVDAFVYCLAQSTGDLFRDFRTMMHVRNVDLSKADFVKVLDEAKS